MDWGGGKETLLLLLGKRRQERNAINILISNYTDCTDPKLIFEKVHRFYEELYSSIFYIIILKNIFPILMNYE